MTQRVIQWSSPWILESPIEDPLPIPWELPQESEKALVRGRAPGVTPWSTAYPIQDDFYTRTAKPTRDSIRDNSGWDYGREMGFYPGQAFMTPGVRPGVGGGWRAYESDFRRSGCVPRNDVSSFCRLNPDRFECRQSIQQGSLGKCAL